MDFCNLCGSTLVKGVCPHCGQSAMREASESVYQCLSKAAECLRKQQWADAETSILKGYEQDPSNNDLQVAELLALTQSLRKVPVSPTAEARVRDLLKGFGKTVKFRFTTYDLEAYRRLLRVHDLSNTTVSWWEALIGLILALCLIGGLILLVYRVIRAPLILGFLLLAGLIGWWFLST